MIPVYVPSKVAPDRARPRRPTCLKRPRAIDDPNSAAEFERISESTAVAKSKPLLEETYNDRNPNRFSESRKHLLFETKGIDSIVSVAPRREGHMKLRPLPRSADTTV